MSKSKFCLLLMLYAQVFYSFGQNNKAIQFTNGKAILQLNDQLDHPFYWWPVTKLDYQVRFSEKPVDTDFRLTEEKTGKDIPFQFSSSADPLQVTVSFLADLHPGEKRIFVLKKGASQQPQQVAVKQEGNVIIIQTNKLAITIPASQQADNAVPGPVLRLSRNAKDWIGTSVFHAGKKKIEKIITEKTGSGAVFAAYKISYLFTGGAVYQATVRCVADYDFVELTEEMKGIAPEDSVSWKIDWRDFKPTHRQAPNHPYGQPTSKPGFARYNWETVDQTMLNYHHGILYGDKTTGKIPFEVGLYQPWPAETSVTSSVFWDKNLSVGVFVKDAALWNDNQYSIWHTSRLLNVKFHYKNDLLTWTYPVSEGVRQTGISLYDHQKDIDFMQNLEKKYEHPSGFKYGPKISQLSYNHFLQNRYGTLDLNKVKNWELSYPVNASIPPVLFKSGKTASVDELERGFLYGDYSLELPVSGPRQNSGYSPVPARDFYEHRVDAFNRLYPGMKPEEKKRFASMFLLHAYVAADDEYMPMKNMLSGHPNFLADVKSIPAMAAFLFPEHPMSQNWADQFEKFIELNTRFHTRPSVESWNAIGGRWTENLGAYTWAFMRPTLRTNYLVQKYHPSLKNRVAGPHTAQLGTWILNSLSAPYNGESLEFYRNEKGVLDKHSWGVVTKEKGPRRVYPPQGAHSLRRQPPSVFWALGESLKNYDPLLAENIQYVSHPDDQDMEALEPSVFSIMYPQKGYDLGTPPDLRSVKLTGYGNILRSKTGTSEELSIHLTQIDQGPNYRWGRAAEGGSGSIYFFAGGKSYSHNGKEDIGDRRVQDTDLLTNFGVFKDGTFKSVGQNVLHRPMYDLGIGQFTEVVPSSDTPYSWPEYQGRSIMLVGSDYFITYDDVYNKNIGARFSWFTHPDEDLPEIEIIKAGGTEDRNKVMKTEIKGSESKGVWYDGTDDFMVFVSHKKGFKVERKPFGAMVTAPDSQQDYIFRSDTTVSWNDPAVSFKGTAGFVRNRADGVKEMVLFHGEKIAANGLTIQLADNEVGISASILTKDRIHGEYFGKQSTVRFSWAGQMPANLKVFIDGLQVATALTGSEIAVNFPSGRHTWQITSSLPVPPRPVITTSDYDHENVQISFQPVAGASRYVVEISNDLGKSFSRLGESANPVFTVKKQNGFTKSHVRVTALNSEYSSEPSSLYPVYFTSKTPVYPDGLKVKNADNGKLVLTWGRVLGSSTYQIYRRKIGEGTYKLIYSGGDRSFTDQVPTTEVMEYAVTSKNRNGESVKSHPVNNDPAGWMIWDPRPGEPFRRVGSIILGIDNSGIKVPAYYPK